MLRDLWTTTTATFIASLLLSTSTPAYATAIHFDERATNDFQACLTASQVKTLTASSSGYASASLAFNRRLTYKPAAIVYP
ncbi:hypothetical protein FRB90_005029, partial [Tulasnella sp. 427]